MKIKKPVAEIKITLDGPVTRKAVREWIEEAIADHREFSGFIGKAKILTAKVRKVDQD